MPDNTNTAPEQPNNQPPAPTPPSQPTPPPAQPAPEVTKPAGPVVSGASLQQGVDQLKQVNVKDLFKAKEGQPKVTSEEKLWALISYIPLLAIIALIIKPKSDYIRLHGRQGLLIFLIFFFCIFVYIVPFIGPLLGGLIQFAMFALGLYSMYQAFIGNWWKIPILGDLAGQLPLDFFTKVTTEAITGQPAAQEPSQGAAEEPKQRPPNPPTEQAPPAPPTEQPPSPQS